MLLLFIHHASDIWEFGHKVTFDGPNKLILVNSGTSDINVERDIYSDWKEWMTLRDNAKYVQALRGAGGDDISATESIGGQFFLLNGWRVRTWEGDHTLDVNENLRIDQGDPDILTKPTAFVPVLGEHNILINSNFSSITNVVTVSGSGGDGFDSSDRDTLQSIETTVNSISGDTTIIRTDVTSILSSTFVASANVLDGSTSNEVRTDLSQPSGFFDGMFVIVHGASGGESRAVEAHINTSGTLFLEPELSFTPVSGNNVVMVGMSHKASFGKAS